jgi:outer membrane protein insertion porin family
MKKKIIVCFIFLTLLNLAFAASGFVVKKIDIEGLQGIERSTVMSYLPLSVGDQLTSEKSSEIIAALYRSGFFDTVTLERSGDTLIIHVQQRPTIGQIKLTGNKTIPSDQLKTALKQMGFYEGQIFDQMILQRIKLSLQQEYVSTGHYDAKVVVNVVAQPRNVVLISITVDEGPIATIKAVNFIGNQAFSERILRNQFKLTKTNLFSFFTHADRYSKEALNADLDSLGDFYLDYGYLKFRVVSKQVDVSKDSRHVTITVTVNEGDQYKISGYDISGQIPVKKSEIDQLITIKPGQYFSRKAIVEINKNITKTLGNYGYANANVNAIPTVNEKDKTVFLTFTIKPGPIVYVHHITFSGNDHTNDVVLRRTIEQQEGGLFSAKQVEDSKSLLMILPSQSVSAVDVTTKPVEGKPDQVDINYNIKEVSTASLSGSLGYAEFNGVSVGAAFTQNNWLGTGKSVSLNANVSKPAKNINYSFYNPYYTKSGIGRSFNIYTSTFNADAARADITDYATDVVGASMSYIVPLSARASWNFGYGFEYNNLKLTSSSSTEATAFEDEYGKQFYQPFLNGGWIYNGFDRLIFPTSGWHHSLNGMITAPVSKRSLQYYKVDYSAVYYHPIFKGFLANFRFDTGYGNGYGKFNTLPFFKNYYSGGIGSVRGYDAGTLGPKDSKGNSLGGKFKVDSSVGIVMPSWISEKLRTTLFVDAGNVSNSVTLKDMRFSTGLELDWYAPVGLLNFSLAKAINPHDGDHSSLFQFNIGTSF